MPFSLLIEVASRAVSTLSDVLAPLFGGAATAAAIVLATVLLRLLLLPVVLRQIGVQRRRDALAPKVEKVRKRHERDPLKAAAEVNALYRAEGVGTGKTLLPLLAQAPFFVVLYSLFRKSSIDGHPNALLDHRLFGVPLGAHWHDSALSDVHTLVFVVVLALLTAVAAFSARRLRRLGQPVLLTLTPFVTVAFAVTVPLGSGLYLFTTTLWTTLENVLLRDRPLPGPGEHGPGEHGPEEHGIAAAGR
jgi:YidC/Oxa1 family membrane protein insertase